MQTYVIERAIGGIGAATSAELQAIAQKSNGVLEQLGNNVQWKHSYVTTDKIYCVYEADSEELVQEHARRGGFPADVVTPVASVIDPSTGNA